MKIGTGGDVFSEEFYVECSKRLLKAGDYRAALFNHTGMHTAGRMGNVGQQKTGHFRIDNDCIKIYSITWHCIPYNSNLVTW